MRFWCSTVESPWSWRFVAYPGIWAVMALLSVPYVIAVRRRGDRDPDAGHKMRLYLAGVIVLWLASDWPLGLLGASYLASAHMAQFMLYTLVAAPLMLLGIPEWMGRRILSRLRAYRFVSFLSKPLVAAAVFNGLLLATHAPWTVDTLRSNQIGSFVMDMLWLFAGLVVWLPVISPLPELRHRSYGVKIVYVFLALGVVPVLPAGFLTFADFPLYSTYELAPRFYGLSAQNDQQIAGVIMKVAGIPVVWSTMSVMMSRWYHQTSGASPAPRPPHLVS